MSQPTNREIFQYELRGQIRFADPMVIRRRYLEETNWEFTDLCRKQRGTPLGEDGNPILELHVPPTEQENAEAKLAAATFAVFGLPPLDPDTGHGFLETEAMSLLGQYLVFLKKN